MSNKFKYKLDTQGNIIECGYNIFDGIEITDEPFQNIEDADNWKFNKDTQEWESTIIDYKYLIIPTSLISSLIDKNNLVYDVLDYTIDIKLSDIKIETRAGNDIEIPVSFIKFSICKILKWEKGDKEQIQGIVALWNSNNPNRQINFPIDFNSKHELDVFIKDNKIEDDESIY